MSSISAPDLLTAREAATLLRLDVRRVQALARAGRLPAVRTGRKWLFARDALRDVLARSATASGTAVGMVAPAPPPSAGVDISARNQLRGRVVRLRVDGLMAEVEIALGDAPDQRLVSLITRSAAERLGLAEGQDVLAIIKSTEIMVARAAVPAPSAPVDPDASAAEHTGQNVSQNA